MIDLDFSQYDRIAQRFHREQREGLAFLKAGIDTRDAAFNRLIERIEQVASRSREPILLLGPTGAGKSRLARHIYELKKQRRQVAGRSAGDSATAAGSAAAGDLLPALLGAEKVAEIDDFDRVQLEHVVRTCRRSRSLAEAGRTLFAVSRQQKAQANDADRLRKYLLRFGLSFAAISPER